MAHSQPIVASVGIGLHLYLVSNGLVNRAHFEIPVGNAGENVGGNYDTLRLHVELSHPDPIWAHIGAWKARVYSDGIDYAPEALKEVTRTLVVTHTKAGNHWRTRGVLVFRGRHILTEHHRRLVLELKRKDTTYLFVWNFPEHLKDL